MCETYAMIKVLNKLTELGMHKPQYFVYEQLKFRHLRLT
ncbi:hypothetical protein THZG08_580004 [Vibrio owensii]|nr:hypothetical protein THZG08_580004 [Vibrio owensii]CAH1586382.1 hypothetical protein THOA03_580004 [Vibrio owensii]